MKKIYIIFAFILICISESTAQYKTMFPFDSITWVHTVEVLDAAINFSYEYKGRIDTIKGNPAYYLEPGNDGYSHIREDLVEGKTWLINTLIYDTVEWLIMDLNLEIGDSILYNYSYFLDDSVYMKVDNIDTLNNRKIIEFDSPNNYLVERIFGYQLKLKYIEGIGPNFGFYFAYNHGSVLCNVYHQDSLVYALDTISQGCPTWTDVEDYDKGKKINVQPNPAQTYIQFQFEDAALLPNDLYLFSITGELLLYQKFTNNSQVVNLSDLNAQIIFYQIINDEIHYNGKFLKQ